MMVQCGPGSQRIKACYCSKQSKNHFHNSGWLMLVLQGMIPAMDLSLERPKDSSLKMALGSIQVCFFFDWCIHLEFLRCDHFCHSARRGSCLGHFAR